MAINRSFIIVKPDGVQRGLIGETIRRFEDRKLKFVAMKLIRISEEKAAEHYAEHIDKEFYPRLCRYITSSPVMVAVLEGNDAIQQVRNMVGSTNPVDADPGTIRADYGHELPINVIHASDSTLSADREIKIYFCTDEILEYELDPEKWAIGLEHEFNRIG